MADDLYFMFMSPSTSSPLLPVVEFKPRIKPHDFLMHSNLGGMSVRGAMRVVTIVEPPPIPDAPGVAALVAAGWQWDGYAFRLGTAALDTARVLGGRYAHRLPTNRRAKRTAAKVRRRARKGGRP